MTTPKTRLRRGPDILDTAITATGAVTFAALAAWDFILGPGGHLAWVETTAAILSLHCIHERRKRRQAENDLATFRRNAGCDDT